MGKSYQARRIDVSLLARVAQKGGRVQNNIKSLSTGTPFVGSLEGRGRIQVSTRRGALILELVTLRREVISWTATGAKGTRAGFLVPLGFFFLTS
mgnify:CR=1 FL=1